MAIVKTPASTSSASLAMTLVGLVARPMCDTERVANA
jgi:hypothetical protein